MKSATKIKGQSPQGIVSCAMRVVRELTTNYMGSGNEKLRETSDIMSDVSKLCVGHFHIVVDTWNTACFGSIFGK